MTKYKPHSLCHTFANNLKQKGVEPRYLEEVLGHAPINKITDDYTEKYKPEILLENLRFAEFKEIDWEGLKD
ncbi:MAG: tyrosine-type recombinase/integrase [Proteobacteria bacterium]|nr:tyrosine-type recombinase/integrase [Pseudomonadota bacterium]